MAITLQCPFCAEEIAANAVKCKHCKEFLMKTEETLSTKGDAYKWFIRILIGVGCSVIGLFILGTIGLITGPNRYPWQNYCNDTCAAALGRIQMQKYNDEDCSELRGDEMLYKVFRPDQLQLYNERIAAIRDRIAYSQCPNNL